MDLLKDLITNDKNKVELLKLKEKLSIQKEYIKKNNELIQKYNETEDINKQLICELKSKNNLLNKQISNFKLQNEEKNRF